MLISISAQLKIPASCKLVCYAMPAYEQTFVLLCQDYLIKEGNEHPKNHKDPSIIHHIFHVDKDSNILHEYEFDEDVKQVFMVSDREMLVPLIKAKKLILIDLRSKDHKTIPFVFHETEFREIFYFGLTKYICIIENCIFQGQEQMLLAYINPFSKKKALVKPRLKSKENYQNQRNNQNYDTRRSSYIQKGDHHSLIVVFQKCDQFSPHLIYLVFGQEGHLRGVKSEKFPLKVFDYFNITYSTLNLWKFENNRYAILDRKTKGRTQQMKLFNRQTSLSKNFKYFDKKSQNIKVEFIQDLILLRQFEYYFDLQHKKINTLCTDQYIDITSEETIYKIIGSQFFTHDIICDYDPYALIQFGQDADKECIIRQNKQFEMKQVYMNMLLDINEDFDDDLLLDSMNLLVDI